MASASIPIKSLTTMHPDYNPVVKLPSGEVRGILEVYQELYEGGVKFDPVKGKYLRPREADMNPKYKEIRLACAEYSAEIGEKIDWMAGQCMAENPRFETTNEYFETLNDDVDGDGADLAELVFVCGVNLQVHFRTYLAVSFPESEPGASLKDAKDRGLTDGKVFMLDSATVEDWEYDKQKRLVFVRIHTQELERNTDGTQSENERHTWTLYRMQPDGVTERSCYTATKKKGADWVEGETASLESPSKPLDYKGRFPIIPVKIPRGLWVMNRARGKATDLFNLQTGMTFISDATMFPVFTISSDRAIKDIWLTEKNALLLKTGEVAQWLAPSGIPIDSLLKQQQEKKLEIKDVSLSRGIDNQNDRYGQQSGTAKEQAAKPAYDIVNLYKSAIKDGLCKAVDLILFVRGEDDEIKIMGLGGLEDQEAKEEKAAEQQEAQAEVNKAKTEPKTETVE